MSRSRARMRASSGSTADLPTRLPGSPSMDPINDRRFERGWAGVHHRGGRPDQTLRPGARGRRGLVRVEPAEIYALLGLNGAGRTTLIRMLLGMITPTSTPTTPTAPGRAYDEGRFSGSPLPKTFRYARHTPTAIPLSRYRCRRNSRRGDRTEFDAYCHLE
ncbi:ATP-binding cassette domain-containing protein [Streptosporangium sp. NPDC023825]|uniref:ATP-binding cassette domain-containing protein n=1 Tax=Streptosporangium sp. NPDC023825 TaxID=3154909 RepID=UPI003444E5FB